MTKQEKRIILILLICFLITFIILILLFINKDNIIRKGKFLTPDFDKNALIGEPTDIDENLTYQKMVIKDDYIVNLCATPKIKENMLTIFFTSSKNNNSYLKIRIIDKNNNILAESGLIKPNNYIKDIELNRSLDDNEQITIKVMSYEKDTYYSTGSFKLNVFVSKDK